MDGCYYFIFEIILIYFINEEIEEEFMNLKLIVIS